MTALELAMDTAYPDAIVSCDGVPFKRPEWTGDNTLYSGGFYWSNCDGDRFYFDTRHEAAADLANEIGMDDQEIGAIMVAGKAVC